MLLAIKPCTPINWRESSARPGPEDYQALLADLDANAHTAARVQPLNPRIINKAPHLHRHELGSFWMRRIDHHVVLFVDDHMAPPTKRWPLSEAT